MMTINIQVPQIHLCQEIVQLKLKMLLEEEMVNKHSFQNGIKSQEIITIICLKK